MEYIIEQLKSVMAIDSPTGFTRKAAEYTMNELRTLGYQPQMTKKGCVLCCLGGEGDAVVFSAHLDTLGAMVAEVKGNGRLRLTRIGGMNANNAECENARVYTRDGKVFEGCFQMNDPSIHVNGDYSTQKRDYDGMELVLDEKVFSKDDTKKLGIEVGDYVCFDPRTKVTESGYIKRRFLDDKLSVGGAGTVHGDASGFGVKFQHGAGTVEAGRFGFLVADIIFISPAAETAGRQQVDGVLVRPDFLGAVDFNQRFSFSDVLGFSHGYSSSPICSIHSSETCSAFLVTGSPRNGPATLEKPRTVSVT